MLLILAGLTGGSDVRYVRHAALTAAARGLRVVVFNSRGTSGSVLTTPRLYSAASTHDLRCARSEQCPPAVRPL